MKISESTKTVFRIIAKLVGSTPEELLSTNVLATLEGMHPIVTCLNKYEVKMVGRKWLAPRQRGLITTIKIEPGSRILVREHAKVVDIELNQHLIFTVKRQDWNEKKPWFTELSAERFRGSLGKTVENIIKLRREKSEHVRYPQGRASSNASDEREQPSSRGKGKHRG